MATDTRAVSIEIDEAVLVQAVRDVVQKGLTEGVGSWETQRLVTEAVRQSIDTAGLPAKIEAALDGRLDQEADAIVSAVVEETLPMVRAAFAAAFRSAMRSMVYGLMLGVPGGGYLSDEQKAAWREAQRVLGET